MAAVAEALLRHECNIEDSQMTILRGHFAMMLVVSTPADVDREALESELEPVRERLDLEAVLAREVSELPGADAGASHVLTVYGADHPGIVHSVCAALAERNVNITDLNTRLVGEPDSPLYAMMMEVSLPEGLSPQQLEEALREVAAREQVEVSLRPLAVDAL